MLKVNQHKWAALVLAACVPVFSLLCVAQTQPPKRPAEPEKPKVEFQKVPDLPCGPGGTAELKGKITGLSSYSGVHVVIYSKCDGMYYVQPTVASPKTEIEDNGTFSADVHGAQEFVVLVVKDDYKPEAQMESLPGTGRNVLAVAKKRPEKK